MKNYLSVDDIVTVAAPANVTSGMPVAVGSIFGVAQVDALTGASVPLVRRGVFRLPKSGDALSQGDPLEFSGGKLAPKDTGTHVATAVADAVAGDATIDAVLI